MKIKKKHKNVIPVERPCSNAIYRFLAFALALFELPPMLFELPLVWLIECFYCREFDPEDRRVTHRTPFDLQKYVGVCGGAHTHTHQNDTKTTPKRHQNDTETTPKQHQPTALFYGGIYVMSIVFHVFLELFLDSEGLFRTF